MSEPMVTIKNADGTTSQVPLSELAAKKDPSSAVAPATTEEVDVAPTGGIQDTSVEEDSSADVPAVSSQTEVVHRVTLDEVRDAKPATVLEETAPEEVVVDTEVVQTEDSVEDAEEVTPSEPALQEEPTISPPELEAAAEVDATTPASTDAVVGAEDELSEVVSTELPETIGTMDLEKDTESVKLKSAVEPVEDELALVGEQHLATTTPNTSIFEHADTEHAWDADDHKSLLEEDMAEVHTEHPKPVQIPLAPEPTPIEIGPSSAAMGTKKVPMQDISAQMSPAPAPSSLAGPTGELGSITLDDFRRLGGRDTIGLADLRAKFETLLKESTLLYMEGVRAWQQSPLFRNYVAITAESVRSGRPVAQIIEAGEGMQLDEWQAINTLQQDVRL